MWFGHERGERRDEIFIKDKLQTLAIIHFLCKSFSLNLCKFVSTQVLTCDKIAKRALFYCCPLNKCYAGTRNLICQYNMNPVCKLLDCLSLTSLREIYFKTN